MQHVFISTLFSFQLMIFRQIHVTLSKRLCCIIVVFNIPKGFHKTWHPIPNLFSRAFPVPYSKHALKVSLWATSRTVLSDLNALPYKQTKRITDTM